MGKPDSGADRSRTGQVSDAGPSDAGAHKAPAGKDRADSAIAMELSTDAAQAASVPSRHDTSPPSNPAADGGSKDTLHDNAGMEAHTMPAAGSGGHPNAASGTGGASAEAGSGAPAEPQSMPADCPRDTYCYGFEAGALDPSGALWPSPSDGSGGLPPNGELTTTPFPASSSNPMLLSRPSSKDGWPKATVGFSGPQAAFSKLVVSFDYAGGDKLITPNPRVILFRFVGTPARNGDSVNVGVLDNDVMLEVQTNGPDPLSAFGRAAAPGVLTHVVATFVRSPGSCTVSVAYAELPLKAAAFPCDVENWQIELGLDLLETPPEKYDDAYFAYFDNLRVSTTP